MRILLLNYEYPPLGGGAARATQNMVHSFITIYPDLEVDIVTSSTGGYEEEALSPVVSIFKLDVGKKGEIHYQHTMELLRYLFKARAFVKKLLRTRKYDIIHAFFAVPAGFIAWRLGKQAPYIVSLRGSDVPYFNDRFNILYHFLTPLLRIILCNAAKVTANSILLKELANRSFPRVPISVITNGIDTDFYTPAISFPVSPFNILFVGRLIQRKGVNYLLQAFAKLRMEKEAVLTIAGTGNLNDVLKKQTDELCLTDSVYFLGELRGKDLLKAYQSANVFVLPSLNEGMSNALLEAMACGLPVIVTDTGGTKELVSANGIIVEKKSADALYNALLKLSTSPDQCIEMGKKSRKIAENMSWNNMAEQYYELYQATLKTGE